MPTEQSKRPRKLARTALELLVYRPNKPLFEESEIHLGELLLRASLCVLLRTFLLLSAQYLDDLLIPRDDLSLLRWWLYRFVLGTPWHLLVGIPRLLIELHFFLIFFRISPFIAPPAPDALRKNKAVVYISLTLVFGLLPVLEILLPSTWLRTSQFLQGFVTQIGTLGLVGCSVWWWWRRMSGAEWEPYSLEYLQTVFSFEGEKEQQNRSTIENTNLLRNQSSPTASALESPRNYVAPN